MLDDAILSFDGRDTAALKRAAVQADAEQADALMGWVAAGGRPAEATTWIIKAMIETGRTEGFDAPTLIDIGTRAADWPVILHLLQLAQHWPAMANRAFGQTHLHHSKPMVRAWALDTFVRACLTGQSDLAAAQAEIARVMQGGKPSEKARARSLLRLTENNA